MANMLSTARAELATQIRAGGVSVFDHIPERVVPPVAIIEPGSPYIEVPGDVFCDMAVRFTVTLFASSAANEVATQALDQLICDVLAAVDTFDMDGVDTPGQYEVGSATYLGSRISFITTTEL